MAIDKMFITGGIAAVVVAAAGGTIFATTMSSSNLASSTQIGEKTNLNGWQQKSNDWYYYKDDAAQTGSIQDNSNWYYFDDSRKMKLNWVQDKNKWYYLGSDGKMRTGWIQDQNKWYYLNSDGTMATNMTIDGCYLNKNGVMIDTPASKAKQIENESTSNSDTTSNQNMITVTEALDLIYKNATENNKIASLDYCELASIDKMKNLFKYYAGAHINEEAYIILRYDKYQDGDPVHYYVGKESGRVYWMPDAGVIQEIKNNDIVNTYIRTGYTQPSK